ncbi:phosphomannomutase [Devosia sp. 1635]|uniref:phosphomannomutase n=1 Tax=Devosia sp. 1635 TaxID=2726066 RepID=UPI0015654721|nr:phosphomannomutase [Devosia sp. 1635]
MSNSSVRFGTSGLRGLAVELQGEVARRYTRGFIEYLASIGASCSGRVYLARDFRPSSPAILQDCAAAIRAAGLTPVDCGLVPTPALAFHAMQNQSASIMITGSHIPADRNGLKFYTPAGEISKADEEGITAAAGKAQSAADASVPPEQDSAAANLYLCRYTSPRPMAGLTGLRIGVFEHSTVARDLLVAALQHSGATVLRLGRRGDFVPVDTEAPNDPVFAPLPGWIAEHRLDAIISADGDGDRPFMVDGNGTFVRGDVLGLLTAQFLQADAIVTPVTSNSAIERTGLFAAVLRTKVGSPYVIAGIDDARAQGYGRIIGFEANGGTLLGSDCSTGSIDLLALPTRDALLPLLAVLGLAARQQVSVANLVAGLPTRPMVSDRLENVPSAASAKFLQRLENEPKFTESFFAPIGAVASLSAVDGLQFRLDTGSTIHYRASGNAPEMRCYVEADHAERARAVLSWALDAAERAVRPADAN